MDAKVFRLSVLTIISAFILVLVIIYATNTDKINRLFGWGQDDNNAVAEEAATDASKEEVIYGDQIGDNLDAFTLDEDFFDETETIPSVVVIKKSNSSDSASTEESVLGEDESSKEKSGTGMAVVGELQNPNPTGAVGPGASQGAATDASGYLTSLPNPPAGGFGTYIPADQTVGGTPVGTTP